MKERSKMDVNITLDKYDNIMNFLRDLKGDYFLALDNLRISGNNKVTKNKDNIFTDKGRLIKNEREIESCKPIIVDRNNNKVAEFDVFVEVGGSFELKDE